MYSTIKSKSRANRFCCRAEAAEHLRGKTVALVGSGPGVLYNPPGFIDSHDVVVRVNNYKLTGPATGKRTDVFYSYFGHAIKKTAEELKADGVKLCWCKCPDDKAVDSPWHEARGKTSGIDFRWVYDLRNDFWFCQTYVPTVQEFQKHFELLNQHVPTTGFSALLDILSCEPKNVFMTGFDFFASRIHNVNERWRGGNPADPIGHSPSGEREWFLANVERLPLTMDSTLASVVAGTFRAPPRLPLPKPGRKRLMSRRKRSA